MKYFRSSLFWTYPPLIVHVHVHADAVIFICSFLGVMPAYVPEDKTLATKLVTFFPRNTSAPTHHALIVMFNAETGVPETVI